MGLLVQLYFSSSVLRISTNVELNIIYHMESSAPSGKSTTEPPPKKWGEFWGSAIAIFTLILPVAAIVHYSPASRVQVQSLPALPPAVLTE
ncbi:hypothetical protein Cha6605_3253 [Chamaesiphon minutus PCC 6605]|uniref:Uncharacterized protein n=2 Tax=Chamaesiphon TaxID=217161 RepID=K9UI10_CHAP6|nr:hypothetical protein Cha6605_3253 [Chamaesiphon minutus PCC 6605]